MPRSMIAKTSGLDVRTGRSSSVDAAPLLCAGLTTFSALRNSPARAGDSVAMFGVGGLGHLGVQYARRMGFEVVGIDRGAGDRAELAKKLARTTISIALSRMSQRRSRLWGRHSRY